jgi:hypothetical protein
LARATSLFGVAASTPPRVVFDDMALCVHYLATTLANGADHNDVDIGMTELLWHVLLLLLLHVTCECCSVRCCQFESAKFTLVSTTYNLYYASSKITVLFVVARCRRRLLLHGP